MSKFFALGSFVACLTVCTPTPEAVPTSLEVVPASLEAVPASLEAEPEGVEDTPAPLLPASVRAKVVIDDEAGAKRFEGVWLVVEGGERLLISYRADPWWLPFEGKMVEVKGAGYMPEGQAIVADHFRVHEMRMLEPGPEDSIVWVTKEKELTGKFTSYEWPMKSKLAAERTTVFETHEGTRYWLSNALEPAPMLDQAVQVRAREVEPSPFAAHPGGRHLWVIEVE